MPVQIVKTVPNEAIDIIRRGAGVWVVPSPSHLTSAEKRLLDGSTNVLWGDVLLTLPTFLKKLSYPYKLSIPPILMRMLILDILHNTPLVYFEPVKDELTIGHQFTEAISKLRSNLISSDQLKKDLEERGSLKEYDLLVVLDKYENVLYKHGLFDDGLSLDEIISTLGARPEEVFSRLKSFNNRDIELIIFDGFEPLEPGLVKLITRLNRFLPRISILIVCGLIRRHPIYTKYQDIIEQPLIEHLGLVPHVETEETNFSDICPSAELHACRSVGNECRFIAECIHQLTDRGLTTEKIGLVVKPNSESLTELIISLKKYGLIPAHAFSCFEGLRKLIKKEITSSDSLGELAKRLTNLSSRIKDNYMNSESLPHTAAGLLQLNSLFNEILSIESITDPPIHFHAIKNALLSAVQPNPRSLLDTKKLPFTWLWWGDNLYPALEAQLIPSLYQGGVPPEAPHPIFFQDPSFLPGNAPSYFSSIFPQTDYLQAAEIYRFRKYVTSASNRIVLSYSRISYNGKETYPAWVTALIKADEIDEVHRPHPAQLMDTDKANIIKRAQNELPSRHGARWEATPIICEQASKTHIKEKFADHAFSATQLEKYARCPYEYFLERVMDLKPIIPPTPEINPRDRGTIIHHILELFYKRETENLLKFIRNEIKWNILNENLKKYVEEAAAEHQDIISKTHPALVEHFKKKAYILCANSIREEINLINMMSYPLLPAYAEWEFGGGETPYLVVKDNGMEAEAKIGGVVDRIDCDPEHNTFSITDYKSGNTDSILGKITKGEHLQLPIYIEATSRLLLPKMKAVGAFLFSIKQMEKKHGMAREDARSFYFPNTNRRIFVDKEKWQGLIDQALRAAAAHIENIRNSKFSPDTSRCNHICDFKDICRYGNK